MKTTLATLAFSLLTLAAAGSAADAQDYRYNPYYGYDRPAPRVVVRPDRQPYYDDYSNYYPAARGFGDRSSAIRGNIRGCSVDLGYGRYESCDR